MIKLKLSTPLGATFLALALLIGGCGGGGGSSDSAQAELSSAVAPVVPLEISNTVPGTYQWDDLFEGMPVYIDRTYVFQGIPAEVQGQKYLQTANNDKSVSDPAAIQFDVNQPVTVFVAYDNRVSTVPSWLASWTDTGMTLGTTDADLSIYQNEFPAGTITLGGNEIARSMYSVVVKPKDGVQSGGALTISGSPLNGITEGMVYGFIPTATGGSATRTFSITNKPAWATFDSNTGSLTGTPGVGDIGMVFSGITISVMAGQETASLPTFSITVLATGNGVASLSWNPPTQNVDDSPLTDLAGYTIYYGTSAGSYPNSKRINNPGITTGLVENLPPGTWSFVVTAFDQFGNESNYSNVATKTISAL